MSGTMKKVVRYGGALLAAGLTWEIGRKLFGKRAPTPTPPPPNPRTGTIIAGGAKNQ